MLLHYHLTAPADFSSVNSELLVFPAGSVGDVVFRVPIVEDIMVEDMETFTVGLEVAPNDGLEDRIVIGTSSPAVVTIIDNNSKICCHVLCVLCRCCCV